VNRTISLTAIVLTAALSLVACGTEEQTAPPKAEGKPKICLVMKSLANEYFQDMQKGAKAHADQRGDLELEVSGIQNETDVDGQVALIDKCIATQVQAVVLAPADSKALVQSVVKANKAGIKVVNIDVRLDEQALKEAGISVPYVGPDNRLGAKESGLELAKLLGAGGKVVILEGNPGADNAAQRKLGFTDAVAEGKLKLVASRTAHWETDEANAVFGNMLTADPTIAGVLASNDSMALGALKVIQERKAKVKVASFDNIPAIKSYVKSGVVVATLDQFGGEQAAFGIDYAMKMLDGENVGGWQKTKMKLITSANIG
jgi:ribose transport system substrate-binding protein